MVFEPEENRRTNENRQAEDLPRLCHVLLNGSPYPMAAVQGADHILRYVNPAFCRLVGKPCEELTGTPAARAMPEGEACVLLLDQTLHLATQLEPRPKRSETDPLLWPYVMWAIPGAGVQPMGIMIQVTDPVVTPLVSKRMTEMNQELILGAVYQHEQAEAARELNRRLREENTEHQYTEETLKEGLEAMERGRLMAEGASLAKSDYLAHISHELRTPLTAMLGLSEMLQDAAEGIQDKHFATDLAKIRDAGGYLLKLISGILDMSKMEAGKMPVCLDTFRVHDLLQSVVEQVRPLVEKNRNIFEVNLANDMGDMYSDEVKVRQILFNLVGNAAKFSISGTVTLEAERAKIGADVVIFRVRDTGIGIAPKELEKIFEQFYQVPERRGTRIQAGTGLGLTLCKQMCELLQGTITAESSPGQGSLFTVKLPANYL